MLAGLFAAGSEITAAALSAAAPLAAFKYADQNSGQSNTTLVNDSDLNLALVAGATYVGYGMIVAAASTAANYSCTLTAPTGAAGGWNPNPYVSTGGAYFIPVGAAGFLGFGTTAGVGMQGTAQNQAFSVQFSVVMGATAGSLQWQFAQRVSDASNCNTRAYSYLLAWRIA